MARPRIPIGTFGDIKVTCLREKTKDKPAMYAARARFRMRNGSYRRLEYHGPSETAAKNALKAAASRLADEVTGKQINGDTRIARVAELWLAELDRKVKTGDRARRTHDEYSDTVRNHILPRLGELTCRELQDDVAACNDTVHGVQDKTGTAAAIRTKTVLNQICGYAVLHKAMTSNPVKNVAPIENRGQKKPIKALQPEQRRDFLVKLQQWVEQRVDKEVNGRRYSLGPRAKSWTDLPEIAIAQFATGGRIGEVLALDAADVDAASREVTLSHHLVREKGVGIVRVPGRKGGEPPVTVRVPSWSVPMWRRRKLESGGGPLFSAWNGGWEDLRNVSGRLREACDEIGYGWVASHVFRRTVGTHLGQSNVSNEAIADQLGNTPEMVQRHYRAPKVANEAVAEVLESLFDQPESESDVEAGGGAEDIG